MQRWFFDNDEETFEMSPSCSSSVSNIEADSADVFMQRTFNVVVNFDLCHNEKVAITGGCDGLGNWKPKKCVLMTHEEGSNSWKATISLPRNRPINYRYFICGLDSSTDEIIIRKWETHLGARTLEEFREGGNTVPNDTFGYVEGVEKIDRGWLTFETIIQLKFFNAPFKWKQQMKKRLLYVKVTSINLRIHGDNNQHASAMSPLEDSLSNDTRENGTDVPSFGFSEVAKLKYNESVIHTQSQFGISCGEEDLVIFHMTVADPESTAYLVDLYTYRSKASTDEPPNHFGYHYILPNLLKRSEGNLEIPITCASKHRPLGMMQIGYLIVKPFQSHNFDMKVSYERYWNRKWTGLDVGHRGSGTSFKAKDAVIRENTITSLQNAAAHGADMVEFDVQLSKDLVPVIYHDFMVYVSLKSKTNQQDNDYLEIPMRELSLDQLKNLKVYHVAEGRSKEARSFRNDDLQEHQPFPQLSDVLEVIDSHVGFNIEIKWSQKLADGTMEEEFEHVIDRNLYVDCILDVVLRKAAGRRIVFSCFDPDICTMLRFKQNLYPVMFLTLGVTTKYKKFLDPRGNTIEAAVCNSLTMELLGIVAHTEDLLRDPTQVNLAKDRGLIVFCWGDDNNSKDTILLLKNMGLHAIIYDKMDILTTKEIKQSVFLVQAKQNQSELFGLQCLERQKEWHQKENVHFEGRETCNLDTQLKKESSSQTTRRGRASPWILLYIQQALCLPLENSTRIIYDQRQTGKYNIQISIKDVAIIEVDKNEFIDDTINDADEYYYDEDDLTIKPISTWMISSTTTVKSRPLSSTSTKEPMDPQLVTDKQEVNVLNWSAHTTTINDASLNSSFNLHISAPLSPSPTHNSIAPETAARLVVKPVKHDEKVMRDIPRLHTEKRSRQDTSLVTHIAPNRFYEIKAQPLSIKKLAICKSSYFVDSNGNCRKRRRSTFLKSLFDMLKLMRIKDT